MTTSEVPDGPVRVRDMPWEEMQKLLRTIGPEIGRLALRGDRFAQAVLARYQYAFEHPTDKAANDELRTAVEDYVSRDLRDAERVELGSRFGHRLPEAEKERGPRIFVPGEVGKS